MSESQPLCPSCTHNVVVRYLLKDVPTEGRGCEWHIKSFPTATVCRDYEREAGVD